MKYFGKKSISSTIKIVIDICLYLMVFFYVIGLIMYSTGHSTHELINPFMYTDVALIFHKPLELSPHLFLLTLPDFIAGVIILKLLSTLFKNFAQEKVFIEDNFSKIKWVGIAIIVTSIIDPIVYIFKTSFANKLIEIDNAELSAVWGIGNLLIGAIILTISALFQRAINLKKENDLTI